MIDQIDLALLLALFAVGTIAGFVDAVAGGGGLIVVPTLLATGMAPVSVLATNKFQGAVGTAVATLTYAQKGLIDFRSLAMAILLTFIGSATGSWLVRQIDAEALRAFVPIALILIALYFMFAPKLGDEDRVERLPKILIPIMGFMIGFYDGVFGPGTGSFFTIGFVALFGFGLTRATANTKALNLTSNLASLAIFIPAGLVVWPIALTMAAGQVLGGYLGAAAGIRHGAKFIKPLVVIVSVAMALKLIFWP